MRAGDARAARCTRPIESVVFARSHRRSRKCRGRFEVSFLKLTTQTVRERNLGIAGEPGCRFEAGIAVGQLNLEHGGLCHACRMPARKCPVKTGPAAPTLRIERSTESAPCQLSRQRGTKVAVHDKIRGFPWPASITRSKRGTRFAREDFLFGEEPNAFLVSAAAYVVRFAFRPGATGGT
jgi:hypothetical protein